MSLSRQWSAVVHDVRVLIIVFVWLDGQHKTNSSTGKIAQVINTGLVATLRLDEK